jgi:hypothetical protein
MSEQYVYGKVWGAKESTLPDGRRVYMPVVIDLEELPNYNPPGFTGWFFTRKGDRVATLVAPGDTIRLEVVGSTSVPVTRSA